MEPRKVPIQNLTPGLVKGVEVVLPDGDSYKESYFEWTAAKLSAVFDASEVTGGFLQSWKHQPLFTQAENHVDAEMFYFMGGSAFMLFVDYQDGLPNPQTAQVVRIQPGTRLIIAKRKGHFVPVAETEVPVSVVVVAPPMDAPRKDLSQPVLGMN